MIWEVNSNNILEFSSQIIVLIKTGKISIKMILYLIDSFSKIRNKDIVLFADLYHKILDAFSCVIKPENDKLATLLFHKGFTFNNFTPYYEVDNILNIFSDDSPLHFIAWDKVDELKSKFPNLEIDETINFRFTPLDCACNFGSELCFNYLKNKGAQYSKDSAKLAIKGRNKNIFMQMIEDGQSFDNIINTALDYRNYEVAEYLKTKLGQKPDSLAESLHFGNYDIASYLISNGADINNIYILFLSISIII
ncbi:hypothetical protein TVAG_233250 [Trichomonas vaginalis G3]|uniref:DUF3447 domain-containing protein n=1 Tax=Trichomonas vaginalis (strain ATCC PRA-98 / G3) TaxID=412133 RepID=A2ERZ4_TRIV3|nr:spectrin binding [Trichomonas vaginalis G3]EAY04589.1 hypothetical protein TVAG_233250 [Trichomonas vaginalis G3]KAI5516090.1 spectrin binding [Trichomonas vaginalis G3]|eukprot:XP_001316812.1 hypothetical protein [Trichomonas vaginalis G3]